MAFTHEGICMDNVGSSVAVAHKATRRARKGQLARCWLVGIALFIVNLCFVKTDSVAADNSIPNLKLFAYHQFRTWDQFSCYNYLIFKESSWNYKARNNSHFGLGQMRNPIVAKLSPREQIVMHMRYVGHRYGYVNKEPNACRAAEHFDKKGWH